MDEKKYECLQSLLLHFMYYTIETYDPLEDEEVIKLYVEEVTKGEVEMAIQEAKAILKEEPFPEDWVVNTAMRGPFTSASELEKKNKGLPYHRPTVEEWIEWMIVELERGYAKKYGDKN